MLDIKPNIIFAILVISRYISNLTNTYYSAIKRIFRYLRIIV